ncbi:MAG: transcriptional repressor [Deferribacteraceae bacterium]|jgi:Fur family peroxide stress response transcriptional regulator|nr:transcriptional repressor [Deferribacteraceae bacterium]
MRSPRNTFQRRLIYDSVAELGTHPTAEEVYEQVIKTHPSISKATVYRNLGQMAETGELLNIGNFNGSIHYDHNCYEHYHFICTECGHIFDSPAVNLAGILDNMPNIDGFHVTGYNLSFIGVCSQCK